MAKVAFALTLLLFFFAFANARTPFEVPGSDVSDGELEKSVTESDTKPTLLLPSEKVISEPTSIGVLKTVEATPVEIESGTVGTTEDLTAESQTQTLDLQRPLTIVRFQPINRHFRRGCHHGIKPMRPRIEGSERSYGDDMILDGERKVFDREMFDWKEFHPEMFRGGERKESDPVMFDRKQFDPEMFRGGERKEFDPEMFRDGERKEFDPEMFRPDGARQIPPRWMKFHHHHDHDHHHEGMRWLPFRRHHHDHDRFGKHSFMKPFHHDEHEEKREDGEREDDEEEREEGGLLKRFRKFLLH